MKNHTISIIDPKTNQIVSVMKFTPNASANTTITETLTTNAGNATGEKFTPENTTTNEILTKNTGNATTNENLTNKFSALQGK